MKPFYYIRSMVEHSLELQYLKSRGRRIKIILGYIVYLRAAWVLEILSQKNQNLK